MTFGPEKIRVKYLNSFSTNLTKGKIYEAKAVAEIKNDKKENVNCHYRAKDDKGKFVYVGVDPQHLKRGWDFVKEGD